MPGRWPSVNAAFTRVFQIPALPPGATADEVRTLVGVQLEMPDACCRVSCCRGEQMPVSELRMKDGRILEQEHFSVPLEGDRIIHVWQFRDITHRKQEEEELRLSRHRLRNLSAHLESAREDERRELGRTLHDEVGQLLTGIRLEVASAVERIPRARHRRGVSDRRSAAGGGRARRSVHRDRAARHQRPASAGAGTPRADVGGPLGSGGLPTANGHSLPRLVRSRAGRGSHRGHNPLPHPARSADQRRTARPCRHGVDLAQAAAGPDHHGGAGQWQGHFRRRAEESRRPWACSA